MLDRNLWSGSYERSAFPKYDCPRCERGRLIGDISDLSMKEPAFSKALSKEPDWEPDWDTERFTLTLTCDNPGCGEIALAIGDTNVIEYYDDEYDAWGMISLLRPRSIFPAPKIIQVDEEVPENIKRELFKAFELFWVDFNACANRLRVSVELLLNHLKVPTTGVDKNGKTRNLDLNGRISVFEQTTPEHAPTLTALRMIGNLGSHGSEVDREPLLDAFEIYEYSLSELCGQRKARIDQLRQKLIANKGKY